MRGLLRNNYYSMSDNMMVSAIIVTLVGVLSLVVGNLSWAISVSIFMFPLNIGTSLQTDEASKWTKFEITMPISRKTIVQCKYLSYLMLVLIGMIFSLVIVSIAVLLGFEIDMGIIFNSFSTGLCVSLLVGSILYPLILISSATKIELIIIVATIAAFIFISVLSMFLSQTINTLNDFTIRTALIVISTLCFMGSYLMSVHLHRKKEF